MLNDNDIDFKSCDINVIYFIDVLLSNSGNALLKKAILVKL